MSSVNRDLSKARCVLNPEGIALLRAAIGGPPDRRPTARRWVRYLRREAIERETPMGTNDPNSFNASTSRAQQNFQHFHKRNQARVEQDNERWAANLAASGAARANRRALRTTANDARNAAPTKVPKSRRGPLRLFLGLLILSLVAGAGLFEYQTGWEASALVRGGEVTGSVRPGAAWNLRAGPSVRSDIVGQVEPGDSLTVACLHNGWAKLQAPRRGVFVYSDGLSLKAMPPAC
jgi:hypothetical protein